jgi:ABC-2 type transport system ATP-binding protein
VSENGNGSGHSTTGARDTRAALHVEATDVSRFVRALPQLAARHGIRLYEVSPADESLESVFSYLVTR